MRLPSEHDLVVRYRRYTDELDDTRLLLELGNVKQYYLAGKALFK